MLRIVRALCLSIALLLGLTLAGVTTAQTTGDPVGVWNGTLKTPQGGLLLILTVTRSAEGPLLAQLESPDQGSGKIPVTAISAVNNQLSFDIKAIGASYKGVWNAKNQAWDGTFSQGADMSLTLVRGQPPAKPVIAGIDGMWMGKVTRNGVDLRLNLRVMTGPRGTIAAFDSPDQLIYGLAVQDLARDNKSVRFKLAAAGAVYQGTLSDDLQRLTGTWSVPNQPPAMVVFVRSVAAAANAPPKRPQTPQPPFPYKAEEVAFDNTAEIGVHLAGTLTIPAGKGPFPVAIMITGSGQQDRDETLLGHKPFWVIADYLSRRGIAVLRVDDRGMGKSTGDFANATSADFATDANAAFAYLRTRKDIRQDAIGFIGHSEGGMIGPIAMATNKQVAFLIMMAGPGTALDQLMVSQRRLIGLSMGQSEAQIERASPVWGAIFKAMQSGRTLEDGRAAALAVLTPDALAALGAPADTDKKMLISNFATPWFRYFLIYDPAPNLRAITVPVLAMNGSLDRQVPPKENLAAIRAALANNRDATVVEIPGLNHLFQTAKTGAVGEYAAIEETIAPVALQRMANWINARFPPISR